MANIKHTSGTKQTSTKVFTWIGEYLRNDHNDSSHLSLQTYIFNIEPDMLQKYARIYVIYFFLKYKILTMHQIQYYNIAILYFVMVHKQICLYDFWLQLFCLTSTNLRNVLYADWTRHIKYTPTPMLFYANISAVELF